MARSKKVEIIYHNGKPDGIKIIRRALSTVTTFVIPRPLLSEAKKIKGIDNPGIYYLINEDENNRIAQIYVGQTRNGVIRLDDHNRRKDFWNKAIMFLADSNTFTLDMISGLEEYAIEKAHEAKRYTVENAVKPNFEIAEYDLPLIEELFEEIEFIMATLGYSFINPKKESISKEIYHTTSNQVNGLGYYDGDKFIVLEDSEIDMSKPALSNYVEIQRQEMLANKQIIKKEDKYYLNVSVSFSNPSSAAMFVLGLSRNGWTEWKDIKGRTLDNIFRNNEN